MRRLLFATLVLLASCAEEPELLVGNDLTVLEGATAITGSATIPDSVIAISGDRILRIGKTGQFRFPADAAVIDLDGKWVVPGFVDTHAHLNDSEAMDEVLRTLVQHGITAVRVPAGLEEANVALRDAIQKGERFGPRIQTAGMPIDTPDGPFTWMRIVSTAEEMRREVRRQADLGVDYIKLYRTVGPDLARAAVDEAHALGIKVLGHLNMTTWSEASQMGMDGIVHSGVFAPTWELAPESEWEVIRRAFNKGREEGDEAGFRILREAVDLDSDVTEQWIDELVSRGTPLEPNLVMLVGLLWGTDETVYQSFKPELAPESWRGTYRLNFPYAATASKTSAWISEGRATYPLFEQIAVKLFRSGAIVSVGTDLMNPWMTPGTSYHRELELMANAGLTGAEILKAATLHGAMAMGLEDKIGTIEEGKASDLVILSADPLEDVANFGAIEFVVLRGELVRPTNAGTAETKPSSE